MLLSIYISTWFNEQLREPVNFWYIENTLRQKAYKGRELLNFCEKNIEYQFLFEKWPPATALNCIGQIGPIWSLLVFQN